MKSGKQRKSEIKAARLLRAARVLSTARATARVPHAPHAIPRGAVLCDPAALTPNNSYGQPSYGMRGYYIDQPFRCRDCGTECIWTAKRQKWWYENGQGAMYSTATRCAPCRAKERERKAAARLTVQQGLQTQARSTSITMKQTPLRNHL